MQDQAIAIVTELCEANRPRVSPQIQNLCYLLSQTIEMALQLELCVLQICGIRPVLGRVDDFSKEIKTLFGGNVPFLLSENVMAEQLSSCTRFLIFLSFINIA